jgi:hypothetical protein
VSKELVTNLKIMDRGAYTNKFSVSTSGTTGFWKTQEKGEERNTLNFKGLRYYDVILACVQEEERVYLHIIFIPFALRL